MECGPFINFCSQLPFKRHGYLKVKEGTLAFSRKKTADGLSFALNQIAAKIVEQTWSKSEQAALHEGLSVLHDHLTSKLSSTCFSPCRSDRLQEKKTKLEGMIQRIANIRRTLSPSYEISSEEQAFVYLMSNGLNGSLSHRVKYAASEQELQAIRFISQKVWNGDYDTYKDRMVGIYQGDHVHVEGDTLYKELLSCKPKRRSSSHYTNVWQRIIPLIPERWIASAKWHPQHEVYGSHLKELLFSKSSDSTYTWFQLENCRDANFISFRPLDAIRHRIFNYVRYQAMHRIHQISGYLSTRKHMLFKKTLSKISTYYERCNIGPYGHGNTHSHPIELGKT